MSSMLKNKKHRKNNITLITLRLVQILVLSLVIVFITPTKSSFKYEFQQGKYWRHETLNAPFDFAINKTEKEIEIEKNELKENHKLYFDYNEEIGEKMQAELQKELSLQCEKENISPEDENRIILQSQKILDKIISHGIISNYKSSNKNSDNNQTIIVVRHNTAQEHEINQYYTINDIENMVNSLILQNQNNIDQKERKFVASAIIKCISPNIVFNQKMSDDVLQSQIEDISPIKGLITKDEKIISKGEFINAEKFQILNSFRSEYEGNELGNNRIYSNIGQYILVVISLLTMLLFIYFTDKAIFRENKKIMLLFSVILLMVAMTMVVLNIDQKYLYVVPLCLSPILIRTFFDTKVSLYVFLVSIIIIGFSVPNSFEFVFYQLITGMIAILSVEHLEKRSEFFNTAIFVFLAYSAIYVAITLVQDANLKHLDIYRFIYFAINAILLLFAFPIVFVLEKIFSMVSEMSLMEYSNTNSKILRELSQKAPGTFQHSVQVANIAEDLIHEIGGNALLVRAGSLHHDIGKLINPMFFTENQSTGINPLNEMENEEAAGIIISHVINGIKLGHKYKLPEPIIDFIRTHHGLGKTKYFYIKEINENPDIEVDVSKYTYPGPLPYSRETAVVMMVDSVEAASRSLKEHTEKSISDLVDNIINSQIKDNQFNNSGITFADIEKIKQILKKKLHSIYHVRIEYPINKKEGR